MESQQAMTRSKAEAEAETQGEREAVAAALACADRLLNCKGAKPVKAEAARLAATGAVLTFGLGPDRGSGRDGSSVTEALGQLRTLGVALTQQVLAATVVEAPAAGSFAPPSRQKINRRASIKAALTPRMPGSKRPRGDDEQQPCGDEAAAAPPPPSQPLTLSSSAEAEVYEHVLTGLLPVRLHSRPFAAVSPRSASLIGLEIVLPARLTSPLNLHRTERWEPCRPRSGARSGMTAPAGPQHRRGTAGLKRRCWLG